MTIIDHPLAMNLTENDKYLMKTATTYHICENEFEKDDKIVADHCHLTGVMKTWTIILNMTPKKTTVTSMKNS